MNPIIYVLPHDSFAYAMLNPMAAARTSCFLPPTPLFNNMNSTFNHHVGLTTTCTSSTLNPLMNSNLLASPLSDANMMNALMDCSMIKPSTLEEKDLDAMIIESSNKVSDEPMLRLDVNDMLTSWEYLFNDCSKESNSPTSSTRSFVSTSSSSPSTMDAYDYSSCHSSAGEELNSPQSVDATNIRIQLQSNTNVYNNKKIGKPDVLKPKRKSVVVTFEDSKKIQMINKSRYREKKSRKRLKYPGESSLNLWKWMD